MILVGLGFTFLLGAIVGSFLNVAVSRLPLEKSLIWPSSRCGVCQQPIAWYDNIPLLSYWLLRGKCRTCRTVFSLQYFGVELATALGFAGLYYLEVVCNIHGWRVAFPAEQILGHAWPMWVGFAWHAALFSFLMVASVCDLGGREIPLRLTLTGTLIGVLGSALLPWPWPSTAALATPQSAFAPRAAWQLADGTLGLGIYAWPLWGPLPGCLAPGGNWQTGLATGVVGALVGTFMMRAIRSAFSFGLRKEALGLGDADLMMMAGSFLGWQMLPIALFLSVPFALVVGLLNMALRRDASLPFGPSLSLGILLTLLGWRWIGQSDQARFLFFGGGLLMTMTLVGGVFLFLSGFVFRYLRGGDEHGEDRDR